MIPHGMEWDDMTELQRIDAVIHLKHGLVKDGPHPAVDFHAVRETIDRLLERRYELTRPKEAACPSL